VDKRIIEVLSGCSVLLLEANHDVDMLMAGPYPYSLKQRILSGRGHLCNEDCGKAAAALYERGVKHLILGHLSAENNFPPLAVATVRGVLRDNGIPDEAVSIALAQRNEPTGIFEVA
jgi:phosphoribosyl 1,2-cyclic phosphodiesterase